MNAKLNLYKSWKKKLFNIDESKTKDYIDSEYQYLFEYINPNFSQMDTDDLIVWHAKMAVLCRYMDLKGYAEGHVSTLFYLSLLRLRNKELNGIGDEEFNLDAVKKLHSTADFYRMGIIQHGQEIVKCKRSGKDEDANIWLKGLFDNTALLMGKEYLQGDNTFSFVMCHFIKRDS